MKSAFYTPAARLPIPPGLAFVCQDGKTSISGGAPRCCQIRSTRVRRLADDVSNTLITAYNAYYAFFWGLCVAITSISQLIKTARDGRSQAEFAQELGISQPSLCRYENGDTNPKAEVIERCMRLVHWGDQEQEPSVDELANKVRTQLGRADQAPLRVALSKLIDGLAAG